jgi:hypothetical protein
VAARILQIYGKYGFPETYRLLENRMEAKEDAVTV